MTLKLFNNNKTVLNEIKGFSFCYVFVFDCCLYTMWLIGVEETIGKGKDTVCFQKICPANSNKYVIDQELQYTDDVLRSIFIAYAYA
jgi:hypothetical protein